MFNSQFMQQAQVLILILFFSQTTWTETEYSHSILLNSEIQSNSASELLGEKKQQPQLSNQQIYQIFKQKLPQQWKVDAMKITNVLIRESQKYGMDPIFTLALIKTESQFNPIAIGSVGEIGLMQVRPETGQWIARKFGYRWLGKNSLKDPAINIKFGVAYLSYLKSKYKNEAIKYINAYNLGPANVYRLGKKVQKHYYAQVVTNRYQDYYQNL